jgi:integrase
MVRKTLTTYTLRALLNAAVDDGVLIANPADRLGRQLRLIVPKTARQEQIKAMSREQTEAMLFAAWENARRLYPFFLTLVRAGLRLGEALALQWDDLDFAAREIRVARSFSKHRLETPKSGHGRTVDMSKQLAATLKEVRATRAAETLQRGWPSLPPWVFAQSSGRRSARAPSDPYSSGS